MSYALTLSHRSVVLLAVAVSVVAVQACRSAAAAADGPGELSHAAIDRLIEPPRHELHRSDRLGMPYRLAVVGDHVVIIDLAADSAMHVVHRRTGAFVRSFGRQGEGPGEFKTVWSLDPVAGSTHELWVYDAGLNRSTYVDLRDGFFEQERLGERMITFVSVASLTGPVRTSRNQFLSLGLFPEGRLGVFGEDGRQAGTVADLPPGAEELAPNIRQHAYQATLLAHPDRHLLAAATRHASRLEIYRSDGSVVAHTEGPLAVAPDYRRSEGGPRSRFVMSKDARFGYVDVAVSRDFIFALFSGRSRESFRGISATLARYVHVFDWAGEFRGALRLETDAISIAVDDAAATLYAVEHEPAPAIAAYDLKELTD